jgi:hypothetical protein
MLVITRTLPEGLLHFFKQLLKYIFFDFVATANRLARS